MILGPLFCFAPVFINVLTMKNNTHKMVLACPFTAIIANTHLMAASSGFKESHDPSPLGNACVIVLVHRQCHQNGQQCACIFLLLFS
jgi:hypothetical protein